MAQEGYLFDRVRLVDWSRAPPGRVTVLSASRLHERQPGAIIFRKVAGPHDQLQVVMTVLETPTAGVHQVALRNSLWFLRTWNASAPAAVRRRCEFWDPASRDRPCHSRRCWARRPFRTSFAARIVITGSATADENVDEDD